MQKKPKGTYAETPENKVSEMRGLSGKCGVLKAKGRSHWCSIYHRETKQEGIRMSTLFRSSFTGVMRAKNSGLSEQ